MHLELKKPGDNPDPMGFPRYRAEVKLTRNIRPYIWEQFLKNRITEYKFDLIDKNQYKIALANQCLKENYEPIFDEIRY